MSSPKEAEPAVTFGSPSQILPLKRMATPMNAIVSKSMFTGTPWIFSAKFPGIA